LWAGPGLLAAATGESLIRFWDLANDENFFLSLGALASHNVKKSDKVICIAFNREKRMLAAGTKDGMVCTISLQKPLCSQLFSSYHSRNNFVVVLLPIIFTINSEKPWKTHFRFVDYHVALSCSCSNQ
jgi:hypothetical protein